LHRAKPMARGGPLRRVPFKSTLATFKPYRPGPAVPPNVKAALKARARGLCEVWLPGCWIRGTDASHRITTKAGGRHGEAKVEHDRLSDLTFACRPCHRWITSKPYDARSIGLALKEGDDPIAWPVQLLLHDEGLDLLTDDGRVLYPDGHEVSR